MSFYNIDITKAILVYIMSINVNEEHPASHMADTRWCSSPVGGVMFAGLCLAAVELPANGDE